MYILRKNTTPNFEIVPRKILSGTIFILLKSEFTQEVQNIPCDYDTLENENYWLRLSSFPISKVNEKFSFELSNDLNEILMIGQLIVVDEFADIQNYTKVANTKYYT